MSRQLSDAFLKDWSKVSRKAATALLDELLGYTFFGSNVY